MTKREGLVSPTQHAALVVNSPSQTQAYWIPQRHIMYRQTKQVVFCFQNVIVI